MVSIRKGRCLFIILFDLHLAVDWEPDGGNEGMTVFRYGGRTGHENIRSIEYFFRQALHGPAVPSGLSSVYCPRVASLLIKAPQFLLKE